MPNNRLALCLLSAVLLLVALRYTRYFQLYSLQQPPDQPAAEVLGILTVPKAVPHIPNETVVAGGVSRVWGKSVAEGVREGVRRVEGEYGASRVAQRRRAVFIGLKNVLWFYPMRRGGYEDAGFQTVLRRFDSYGLLRGRFMQVRKDVDAVVCLVKYYCWSPEMYKLWEHAPSIRTNKILGSKEIWSTKASYCATLRKALRAETASGAAFLRDFTFECWVLPKHAEEVKLRVAQPPAIKSFIVKPLAAQAGAGIYLATVSDLSSLVTKRVVLQPYLENPYLIDGRKWDMRIYVLVTSVAPVRAYMHRGGFVRFAAGNYSSGSGGGKSSFLTNLSVNNKLRSTEELTWTFDRLRQFFGVHADTVFRDIHKALAKMLVASEIPFKELYKRTVGANFRCRNCYQILGMDVILDANRKPYIIEVNGNPTLRFKATKLNADVKQMEHDAVRLMYDYVDRNVTQGVLEAIHSTCGKDGSDCTWLSQHHIEYLYMMAKERNNVEGFTRIYPPSALIPQQEEEWLKYLEHLFVSAPERRNFHKLLQKIVQEEKSGVSGG